MSRVSATAPGKLFLLGEYAVLYGAPALVIAVDRRVRVRAELSSEWSVLAPQIGFAEPTTFEAKQDSQFPWLPDLSSHPELRMLDAVLVEVTKTAGTEIPPLKLEIDSSAFYLAGQKLGLGSSAAVCCALVRALCELLGLTLDDTEQFELANRAHRNAQGGKGSGGDVAACFFGGLVRFRKGSAPERLSWPRDLAVLAVTTGSGSSTTELVSQVEQYRERSPHEFDADISRLSELADLADLLSGQTFEHAFGGELEANEILRVANEYFEALIRLGEHSGAEIVTLEHLRLREIASVSGAVFKTSGAGGGDLGLVFAKLEGLDQVRSAFQEAGVSVIPVPISSYGAQVEAK